MSLVILVLMVRKLLIPLKLPEESLFGHIPLEVKVDNFGNVKIERDSQMDTNGSGLVDEGNDEI